MSGVTPIRALHGPAKVERSRASSRPATSATGAVTEELVRTDDIWRANDWNNPDVFTTRLTLDAGMSYTLV